MFVMATVGLLVSTKLAVSARLLCIMKVKAARLVVGNRLLVQLASPKPVEGVAVTV